MAKITRVFSLTLLCCALGFMCSELRAQEEYFKIESPETRKEAEKKERRDKQDKPAEFGENSFKDKLRLGGSVGLRVGTYTNINLSPMVGLGLTDNFTVAAGPTYIYVRSRYYVPTQSESYYGGRIMARYNFVPMIHIQGEYELMSVSFYNHGAGKYQNVNKIYDRTWLHSPMLGLGYTQMLSGRFIRGAHMTLMYNFNYNNHINPSINYAYYHPGTMVRNISHYASPIVFRVSFL